MKHFNPKDIKSVDNLKMKIILHPGEVYSRDGDRHFISSKKLIELYGVRRDDIVKTESRELQYTLPKDKRIDEGWVELWPSSEGNYYNIHIQNETPNKKNNR